MKKIIILPLLATILFSCVDLEKDPTDAYSSDTFFTSEDAAVSNLAAVYQYT